MNEGFVDTTHRKLIDYDDKLGIVPIRCLGILIMKHFYYDNKIPEWDIVTITMGLC